MSARLNTVASAVLAAGSVADSGAAAASVAGLWVLVAVSVPVRAASALVVAEPAGLAGPASVPATPVLALVLVPPAAGVASVVALPAA